MIFIVLGMHKSGTTLVSQILHNSGINMGSFDPNLDYDRGNKYEREEALAVDLKILGTDSYDVLQIPKNPQFQINPQISSDIESVINECSSVYQNWGIKDPRMCLTYKQWEAYLPDHKIIVVYRDPAQIWPRFKWRGKRGIFINHHRAYYYLKRWIEYNENILRVLDGSPCQKIVLNYHDLMTSESEFLRLQKFVGQDISDLRDKNLYRNKSQLDCYTRLATWLLSTKHGLRTADTINQLDHWREQT